jgi:bacteriorhodopsin
MAVVMRLVRIMLLVVAVFLGAILVMALGSRDTGAVEKVVLLAGAAVCVWGCFALPRFASWLSAHRRLS